MKENKSEKFELFMNQNHEKNSIFVRLQQDLNALNLAYSELSTLPSFKCVPELESYLSKTSALIQEAQAKQAPLKLLLLGGTGVGKSSLINHLAHKVISSTSHSVRAHTQGFIIHAHQYWQQSLKHEYLDEIWPKDLQVLTRFNYHQIEDLKTLWLIDAPDIDSVMTQHPQRVQKALIEADLPIWVSSPENYRDQINCEFLKLIDQKRSLLAILNKADRLTAEEQDEVLGDAQSFIDDLGFKNTQWFMTACLDPQLSQLPKTQSSLNHQVTQVAVKYELNKLKAYLEQHFDHKEYARIKGLRLAQRLDETVNLLHKPLQSVSKIQAHGLWYDGICTKLIPIFKLGLSLGIQQRLNEQIQELYTHSQTHPHQIKPGSLLMTKLWSVYLVYFKLFPQSLAEEYSEATIKLRIENTRLSSDPYLDVNSLEYTLEEALLETISRFQPALNTFQIKLTQLIDQILLNALTKICVSISFFVIFLFWLNLPISLTLIFTLSLVLLGSLLSALQLSSTLQQETQVFINQHQREFTAQSQNSVNLFLRQDEKITDKLAEAQLLVKYEALNEINYAGAEDAIEQIRVNPAKKTLMLKVYKESLRSLQKHSSTLSSSH